MTRLRKQSSSSGHPDALGPVTRGPKIIAPIPPRPTTPTAPETDSSRATSATFSFSLRPQEVARHLDRFVIGQAEAKKVLSVALCDHFQHVRLTREGKPARFYQKQNVLLLGPTGVGKTHLVRSAADLIGVPFVKADATRFSETGYVGADVDDLVRDLIRRAGGDIRQAEHGIIYLDEADKLATREAGAGRDVSGRGVQTNLLKLMEDADVPIVSPNDVTGQLQGAMATMRGGAPASDTINTRHILFIVSGAFAGMEQVVRRRLTAAGDTSARVASLTGAQLLSAAGTADFVAFGFEPEFIGRLPVRVACHGLNTEDLYNVLLKSESSLIRQYERAFSAYGIRVKFKASGLRRLAQIATSENIGARGLMTACERVFRDFKFQLPSAAVKEFTVTRQLVDDPAGELRALLKR